MHYAAIALFVYNRPEHTEKTIDALKRNQFASESELHIFSDAAKDQSAVKAVTEVRDYLKKITGFKSVTVIERKENLGLAKSITNGVTELINIKGKLIVLEDDIVTSPYFLKFMNEGLDHYENEKKVWAINGYTYPIDPKGLEEAFLWRMADCWGWATWKDRWQHFEKNPQKLISEFSKNDIYRFNLDGATDLWDQVLDNASGKLNTWAIFWYATVFKMNGLCLNPSRSLVKNIGFDGTGEHCVNYDPYNAGFNKKREVRLYTNSLYECKIAHSRIRTFFKCRLVFQLKKKIKRLYGKVRYLLQGLQ